MELTFEKIQELSVGAVRVFQDPTGIRFRRFTERQVDVIFESDPTERNYQTTGVRIDFFTDAKQVNVTVAAEAKYEILVNDLTACCQLLPAGETLSADLTGDENRVTIVLPSHKEGILTGISLEDATYVRKPSYPVKLAFYGDSITHGWNSEKDSQSYAWLVTRFYDADSRIYGIGGTTFIPAFPEDTGFRPDAVFVAMGTNDYGRDKPMDQIRSDCEAYLKNVAMANPGSKLFCITPIWRWIGSRVKAAGTLAEVRPVIAQIAASVGYTVIDGLSMVSPQFEYYYDKGTHPNDLGFSQYALHLLKAIRPYL